MKQIDLKYSITEQGIVLNTINNKELVHTLSNGYVTVSLYRKAKKLHRLLAEAFISNPDNLPIINHIDGNKQNNELSNLEWCTYSDNIKHAYDTGLRVSNTNFGGKSGSKKGVDNHGSQFTNEDILKIRKLKESNTNKAIALMYECHTSIIQRITQGKSYM